MKDFDTIKLIAKKLGNETGPLEKEQIARWINQSSDNKSLYNELTAISISFPNSCLGMK